MSYMQPYNIESFNRDWINTGNEKTELVSWESDYLEPQINELKLSKEFSGNKNDYVLIRKKNERFEGIISEIELDSTGKKISIKELNSLLNVNVRYSRSFLQSYSCEQFIANLIKTAYVSVDEYQRIKGLEINIISKTSNAKLNLVDNIHNIQAVCATAFNLYGITVNFEINPQEKKIIATIGICPSKEKIIEANLKNIIKKTIEVNQNNESLNKLTIYNKSNETQTVTFYRDSAGAITTNPNGRVTPVIFDTKYIECEAEDFTNQAEEEALNALLPEESENRIELTVMKKDSLIYPEDLKIGQKISVILGNEIYKTRLSGKTTYINETVDLIMGSIRAKLTEQLKKGMR